jgi:tetratricopeptide (TPR) repeat protein
VREDQGDLPGACELWERAHTLVAGLRGGEVDDLEWLFELGQSQFYVGAGFVEQGDLAGAEPWFERYLETARRGTDLTGGERLWRQELAMAIHNLGALDRRRDDHPAALAHFEQATAMGRELLAEQPDDPALWLELADVLSWLGTVRFETVENAPLESARREGRAVALGHFDEERALRRRLLERDPRDPIVRSQLATAESWAARCQAALNPNELPLGPHERALELAGEVCAHVPANVEWQAELALIRFWASPVLLALEDPERAQGMLQEAVVSLQSLVDRDPSRVRWLAELGAAERSLARLEARLTQD